MKKVILLSVLLSIFSIKAYAVDEFGTRFGGQAPAALTGDSTAADKITAIEAYQLQNIEAAAGEEAEKFGPPIPSSLKKSAEEAPAQTP